MNTPKTKEQIKQEILDLLRLPIITDEDLKELIHIIQQEIPF